MCYKIIYKRFLGVLHIEKIMILANHVCFKIGGGSQPSLILEGRSHTASKKTSPYFKKYAKKL